MSQLTYDLLCSRKIIAKITAHSKHFSSGHIDLGLDNLKQCAKLIGNPQENLPPIIHVAGTNGKGSTCKFIASLLAAKGLQSHMFLSPHLVHFSERILINNQLADYEMLNKYLDILLNNIPKGKITFFEIVTLLAFDIFSKIKSDYVVIETGLGGRLDSTNIVSKTILSIITSISMDHMKFLGNDLESIAKEKAGIIKQNSKVVVNCEDKLALEKIKDIALSKGVDLLISNQSFFCNVNDNEFVITQNKTKQYLPLPSIVGDHQCMNFTLALVGLANLGYKFIDTEIKSVLRNTKHQGRMQKLSNGYLFDKLSGKGVQLYIDGCHNPDGAKKIRQTIYTYFKDYKIILIVSIKSNKDYKLFLQCFINQVDLFVAVNSGLENMLSPHDIKDYLIRTGSKCVVGKDINLSFDLIAGQLAKDEFNQQRTLVLCCGSLYFIGKLIKLNSIETNALTNFI